MRFSVWLEREDRLKVIDSNALTDEDQYKLGHAAVVRNGHLLGFHVTDDPDKIHQIINGSKKLTATYRKGVGKYAELGPGLYVSAAPQMWLNRSSGKWDFLKSLNQEQKQRLAQAIKTNKTLTGEKLPDGRIFHHVASFERENAFRYIDEWLKSGHDGILLFLAGQPYNIAFWKPEFLKPLGIDPSPSPTIMEVTFSGKFVDLGNHVSDWPVIAQCIRSGYDGGFVAGGFSSYPQLCIWRKESISNVEIATDIR